MFDESWKFFAYTVSPLLRDIEKSLGQILTNFRKQTILCGTKWTLNGFRKKYTIG